MDSLDNEVRLKIDNVVDKMHKMDCTLLGNKDDAWIMELLFKPGFHRYHLIEWILSKFDYGVGKVPGPQNSPNERMKNLQATISDLGIFRKYSHDIIKGTAPMNKQLAFWCALVDILWLKYELTANLSMTDEGIDLSVEKRKMRSLSEEHKDAGSCISNICESVNLKHLFKPDVLLLTPDVEREMDVLTPTKLKQLRIPSLQEMKTLVKQNPSLPPNELHKSVLLQSDIHIDENKEIFFSENELNKVEDSLLDVSLSIQETAQGAVSDVYNELKPLILHVSPEKFTDVGPSFQKVERHLETLLMLKKSVPKLASSTSKLQKINSELEDLSNQKFADSKSIARLLKEES